MCRILPSGQRRIRNGRNLVRNPRHILGADWQVAHETRLTSLSQADSTLSRKCSLRGADHSGALRWRHVKGSGSGSKTGVADVGGRFNSPRANKPTRFPTSIAPLFRLELCQLLCRLIPVRAVASGVSGAQKAGDRGVRTPGAAARPDLESSSGTVP